MFKRGSENTYMNLISWAVFGILVGTIANVIDPRPLSGGILGAIVLGIGGALIGGFLGSALLGVGISGFNFSSFVVAVIGSLLVLGAQRAFR